MTPLEAEIEAWLVAHEKKNKIFNVCYFRPFNTDRIQRAHQEISKAKKNNDIIPQPCKVCGSTHRVHAHHFKHEEPLNIEWLCPKHHTIRHIDLIKEKEQILQKAFGDSYRLETSLYRGWPSRHQYFPETIISDGESNTN